MQHSKTKVADAIATAFVAGDLEAGELVRQASRILGKRYRWLWPMARRVVQSFGEGARPRRQAVARFILFDSGFSAAYRKHQLRVVEQLGPPATMRPIAAAAAWPAPSIRSSGELAEWLGVTSSQLLWFADLRFLLSRNASTGLSHYRYHQLRKRSGQTRILEAPKPRLKKMQRRILDEILGPIPAHPAVHGFRRGRSIRSFAAPHVGKRVVLRMDLQQFFPSVTVARVQAVFRSVGYPEGVADLLAGICTNTTPRDVWESIPSRLMDRDQARRLLDRPHLPQGAPTSPALANLIAFRMDCRLAALAASSGATYTRYADDLGFSGDRDFERAVKRFHVHASATVMEEGFCVNFRKTRIMRQGVRQRLTGLVVNQTLNIPRPVFDRLKATLNNCVRLGPATQNKHQHDDYRAHLHGRIAFVESINSAKGRKLRRLFERIEW